MGTLRRLLYDVPVQHYHHRGFVRLRRAYSQHTGDPGIAMTAGSLRAAAHRLGRRLLPTLRLHASTSRPAAWRAFSSSTTPSAPPSPSPSPPSSSPSTSRIVFSGIQPTGTPHLGNLLGALFNWKKLLADPQLHRAYFSIVGLHALTVPQDPARLRTERRDMLAALLAVGIDPQRCVLFHQESVPEHAELMWLLGSLTSVGRLKRMTTWKGKVAALTDEESAIAALPFGLFAYPVLQAADILLYGATHVPVGQDQAQHLELARELALTWNRRFAPSSTSRIPNSGDHFTFTPPETLLTENAATARVVSLRDPSVKMSKSDRIPGSRILLDDTPEEVARKIKRAVTDDDTAMTYEPEMRPGVANLLGIIAALESHRSATTVTPEAVAARLNAQHASGEPGARVLKEEATAAIVETLEPMRLEYERLRQDGAYLEEVAGRGRDQAREVAQGTMLKVRRAMGIA